MPIPSVNNLLLPVLKLAADSVEHPTEKMWDRIATEFSLTTDELTVRLKNGTPVIRNRIAWAIVHLELAEALRLVRKGVYQITDRGASLCATNPQKLTIKALHDMYGVPDKAKRKASWSFVEKLRNAKLVRLETI